MFAHVTVAILKHCAKHE